MNNECYHCIVLENNCSLVKVNERSVRPFVEHMISINPESKEPLEFIEKNLSDEVEILAPIIVPFLKDYPCGYPIDKDDSVLIIGNIHNPDALMYTLALLTESAHARGEEIRDSIAFSNPFSIEGISTLTLLMIDNETRPPYSLIVFYNPEEFFKGKSLPCMLKSIGRHNIPVVMVGNAINSIKEEENVTAIKVKI